MIARVTGPFEEFQNGARRALELLSEAQRLLRGAREKYSQARGELTDATEGAGNDRVSASLARLETVGEVLERADVGSVGAGETFTEYLRQIYADAAIVDSGVPSTVDTGPQPAERTPEPRTPVLQGFRPLASHPEAVSEIKPHVGKRNANGRRIAVGRVYDGEGRPLGPVHEADDDGPAGDGKDIVDPWRSYPRMRRHIEAHAAARLRQDENMTKAVVYINMKPCNYPDGCDPNLSALIPEGKTLYVHEVTKRGSTRVWIYPGTGEAIERERGSES
ncbi:hypothetical protein Pen01_60270 [Phytomonospora endophytica]|nr:hypothetical protein Pen01_60270 [Phytomonospora endophytica]